MSNKKLILCKFIFYIGMCVLYSCSWQGLELYFYGKITTEDFDTIQTKPPKMKSIINSTI